MRRDFRVGLEIFAWLVHRSKVVCWRRFPKTRQRSELDLGATARVTANLAWVFRTLGGELKKG